MDYDGVQADTVLKKLLRILYLAGNRKSTETLSGILSIGNLKTCPNRDILSPTRPYLFQ